MTQQSHPPYIFYDFETSSRDFLGQILSYAFIITDETYAIKDTWIGTVKLSRTQIPEPGAILTNKLNIDEVQDTGKSEYDTANDLFQKLNSLIAKHGSATLIGFNGNRFDLHFLRNLMLRHGINPYFYGKLHNLDVLQWVQHLAFEHPDDYPWTSTKNDDDIPYYSFSLEHTATALNLLTDAQTHDAEDDVRLLIDLVKTLESKFGHPLRNFAPIQIHTPDYGTQKILFGKQKVRQYAQSPEDPLHHFEYQYWLGINIEKKSKLLLNLEKFNKLPEDYAEEELLSCMKYINDNKHHFHLLPLTPLEEQLYAPIIENAINTPKITEMTLNQYFELTNKAWDIEYQIHKLGFDKITPLHRAITQILTNPDSYPDIIQELWTNSPKTQEDNYLTQLFNRAYLNLHPSPNPELYKKYMIHRYLNGKIQRDPNEFTPLPDTLTQIEKTLSDPNITETDIQNLNALKNHITQKLNQLTP